MSSRRAPADGSQSRGHGGATTCRIPSRAAQRAGGGLLPARGGALLRPGDGGGVARALGASRARHAAAGPVHPRRREARADGGAHPPDAEAVARTAPELGRGRLGRPGLGQRGARLRDRSRVPGPHRRVPAPRAGIRPDADARGERADRDRRRQLKFLRPARRVRRAGGPGRLRHRLRVAGEPGRVARRRAQARHIPGPPDRRQPELPGDRRHHRRPRSSAGGQGRGGRRRIRGRPVRAANPRLRLRPGLSPRAADGTRRLRRLAA